MSVVYDAGALVAADRSARDLWADHRARLELGVVPVTTAPAVAQVSRSGRQTQLRRFLRGCEVEPFRSEDAHEVGALAGKAAVGDIVDVHVVVAALRGQLDAWSTGHPRAGAPDLDLRRATDSSSSS